MQQSIFIETVAGCDTGCNTPCQAYGFKLVHMPPSIVNYLLHNIDLSVNIVMHGWGNATHYKHWDEIEFVRPVEVCFNDYCPTKLQNIENLNVTVRKTRLYGPAVDTCKNILFIASNENELVHILYDFLYYDVESLQIKSAGPRAFMSLESAIQRVEKFLAEHNSKEESARITGISEFESNDGDRSRPLIRADSISNTQLRAQACFNGPNRYVDLDYVLRMIGQKIDCNKHAGCRNMYSWRIYLEKN
jgi:hypothetical protein